MNNIVLTGFRATGKTSVGKALATKLGYAFSDTDRLLCERLHAPIADIVARHGWPFFRQAEAQL
jgi:Shikimate kinase